MKSESKRKDLIRKEELKELISETSGVTEVLERLCTDSLNFKYFSVVFDWIQKCYKVTCKVSTSSCWCSVSVRLSLLDP